MEQSATVSTESSSGHLAALPGDSNNGLRAATSLLTGIVLTQADDIRRLVDSFVELGLGEEENCDSNNGSGMNDDGSEG